MSHSPVVLLHTDAPERSLKIVKLAHPELSVHTCDNYRDLPEKLLATAAEVVYTVRFAGTPEFPRQALLSNNTVKWISVGGSGTDHLSPWPSEKITVTNSAGVAADMMAEYVLGCLLFFRLNLRQFQQAKNQSLWLNGSVAPVAGSTALIIGLGHTGRAVAQRLKAMGVTVLGTRARPTPTENVDEVHHADALPKLLPRVDAVICTVPLLEETHGLLSHTEFKLLKSNCVLIDVSRGGVVDELAMIDALQTDALSGAALDVFSEEPLPADHPLWSMDNVIVTPHCSSVYDGWEYKSVDMFVENLHRYRNGFELNNTVDPKRGY